MDCRLKMLVIYFFSIAKSVHKPKCGSIFHKEYLINETVKTRKKNPKSYLSWPKKYATGQIDVLGKL